MSANTLGRDQDSLRMTGRLDKVNTSVYTVINQFEPVDPILLLEVSVESSINVVHNWFPAAHQLKPRTIRRRKLAFHRCLRNHRIREYRPQSTLALHQLPQYLSISLFPDLERDSLPAEILSILTVLPLSTPGAGTALGWYSLVSNRVLIRVDFPRPDSPVCQFCSAAMDTSRRD
jgi:hypothetical protein